MENKLLKATAASSQQASQGTQWKGLTIDELKMRRAKALIHREVGRMSLMQSLSDTKQNVSQNGVRALFFNDNTIKGLKKADYAFLSYKVIRLLARLYTRRKRR